MSCFGFASFPADLSTSSAHVLDFCWSKQWLKHKKVGGRLKWELTSSFFVDLFIGMQYPALVAFCFLLTLPSRKAVAVSMSSIGQLLKLSSEVQFFSLKCSVIWKQSIYGTAYLSERRKNKPLNGSGSAVHSRQQIRCRWKNSVNFVLETQQSHREMNFYFKVSFNPGVSCCFFEYACRPFRLSIRIKEQNYRHFIW